MKPCGYILLFLMIGLFMPTAIPVDSERQTRAEASTSADDTEMVQAETATAIDSSDDATADSMADTLFRELHLSPDGIYGVDTTGREWDYDFSRDVFIRGDRDVSGGTATVFTSKGPKPPDVPEAQDLRITRYDGLQMGSVTVAKDEKVVGSIVAMGAVTVEGQVTGDVFSYSMVTVAKTGEIYGDVRAPRIVKMRGAVIHGSRSETDMPQIPEFQFLEKSTYTEFLVSAGLFLFFIFCALLAVAIVPRPIERLKVCVQTGPVKSFFAGLLVWILLTPAMALLCLTIIGIPIAVIIVPIGLILGVILGVLGCSQLIGEKARGWFSFARESQLVRVLIGLVALSSIWLLAGLLNILPSPVSRGFADFFTAIAWIIWGIVATMGIGAIMMTRFGSRDCRRAIMDKFQQFSAEPSPAPPPPSPPPLKPDDDESAK